MEVSWRSLGGLSAVSWRSLGSHLEVDWKSSWQCILRSSVDDVGASRAVVRSRGCLSAVSWRFRCAVTWKSIGSLLGNAFRGLVLMMLGRFVPLWNPSGSQWILIGLTSLIESMRVSPDLR